MKTAKLVELEPPIPVKDRSVWIYDYKPGKVGTTTQEWKDQCRVLSYNPRRDIDTFIKENEDVLMASIMPYDGEMDDERDEREKQEHDYDQMYEISTDLMTDLYGFVMGGDKDVLSCLEGGW